MQRLQELLLGIVIIILVSVVAYTATSYQVNVGSNIVVSSTFGEPDKQIFNDTCPSPIFVPANTTGEYSSFYVNANPALHTAAVACASVCDYGNYVRSSYSCNCDAKGQNCQTCYNYSWGCP